MAHQKEGDSMGGILMGKQSTRENKTIYQLCREAAGLTRAEASEKMDAVSASKIEKFEYETQEPTPYDILQMAYAYKRPDLCNYYCSHKCEIGQRYVPEVEVTNLSNIILETIASLNEIIQTAATKVTDRILWCFVFRLSASLPGFILSS